LDCTFGGNYPIDPKMDMGYYFLGIISNLVCFAHNWNDGTMEYWNVRLDGSGI